ncbi:hypothetical protein NPIL_364781 [Nephila pilipes]|uniref:Uncharacterized protein n=1 Tax=Nephila pilipes TaxID=299642 RepID=A0A8X6IYM4_NEPPI|nr:hypothetical protein NPIL_364781 [Nephila pilipes]
MVIVSQDATVFLLETEGRIRPDRRIHQESNYPTRAIQLSRVTNVGVKSPAQDHREMEAALKMMKVGFECPAQYYRKYLKDCAVDKED